MSAGSWLLLTCDSKVRLVLPATLLLPILLENSRPHRFPFECIYTTSLVRVCRVAASPIRSSSRLVLALTRTRTTTTPEKRANQPVQGRINPRDPDRRRAGGHHPSGLVIQVALIHLPAGRFIDRVGRQDSWLPLGHGPGVILVPEFRWYYKPGRRDRHHDRQGFPCRVRGALCARLLEGMLSMFLSACLPLSHKWKFERSC